ncbi:MAG: DUF4159 domain-containing protein [Planctomycetaceae bacterium]|nr:DUF4159 domain-containing protein [Planctomycetaceae bacterium]
MMSDFEMLDFERNDESVIDSHLIVAAINNGVQYLKSQQKPDGQWQYEVSGHTLGATAMCVLSFLEAGVSKNDSSLIRGVQALRQYRAGENIRDTYPVAVQTMALIRYGDPADQSLLEQNIRWFLQQQINDGSDGQGGWQYNSGFRHYSTFETCYVGLALYEAEQNGITVPHNVWEEIRRFWERTQNKDGSWGYRPLSQGSGDAHSCTTNAGIISLILATGIYDSGRFRVKGDHIQECGQWDPHHVFVRIDRALTSLDKSLVRQLQTGPAWWNVHNMNSDRIHGMHWVHYNLFMVEKVGRLLGRRHIGGYDWYREGTKSLLRQLREHRTHWADRSGETILETACAVSFLAQGRRPMIVSKIKFPHSHGNDQHPYDMEHLLRFAGSRRNFPLGWQYLELDKTTTEELIQSPVLYFSNDRTPLTGNDAETKMIAAKLRTYLDQGGFIVAEALQDDKNFDTGFHELMRLVFPEPDYELALLEPSHPIWSIETRIEPEQRRPIKGITNACRTNVVYIPACDGRPSLSCLWEIARWNGRNDLYSPDIRRQIESGLEIGCNILTYALDSERKYRDQVAELKSLRKNIDSQLDSQNHRGCIFLGLLSHGETNPAPHALPNLLHWVESNLGLPIAERVNSVDITDSNLPEYPILFMFGRRAFRFSPEQRAMLRQHLERGGFLFANSVCSSKLFTESLTNEMYQIFPDLPLRPIPVDDPLFSDIFGGFKIDSLELWQPEQSPDRAVIANLRNTKPELYGICLGGGERWAVIFSPNDIACSLETANFSGCRGYTPNSAVQLAVNFLLYSLSAY